ncbi:MAG TPA: hypothetical protein PLA41_00060 [Candidatus Pacearchaeota archaeon]|nr:hypothetical protein [Candidatus Parcubacteria bacterium]HNZ83856.1 hypothetical protein [Candidatus Pacearchaeota archaeon]HOU45536.1 hypothetical protein [Candidatus Pacearchaeota archaeon]HPM08581.1 hypothetical protein [Candidatus Pacearchaeota archaeon]HQI74306.1 hypothetical protein [Candidatus Pacearchaeota archaeon]
MEKNRFDVIFSFNYSYPDNEGMVLDKIKVQLLSYNGCVVTETDSVEKLFVAIEKIAKTKVWIEGSSIFIKADKNLAKEPSKIISTIKEASHLIF